MIRIIFKSLLSPIDNLLWALKCRFYGKLQIDTLNDLIASQERAWNNFDERNTGKINILPPPAVNPNIKADEETKVNRKVAKKPKTLKDYRMKYDSIRMNVEKKWTNEVKKTEKKLEELYLEARKNHTSSNKITLTQLNRELKQVNSWETLKQYIIKHYGQFV